MGLSLFKRKTNGEEIECDDFDKEFNLCSFMSVNLDPLLCKFQNSGSIVNIVNL